MRPQTAAKRRWQKTSYANLVRNASSGTYFARLRLHGKLIWKTLDTEVLSVAALRLPDKVKELRDEQHRRASASDPRITFGDAAQIYLRNIEASPDLKPRTKAYHAQRLDALLRSWPQLKSTPIGQITKAACVAWRSRFAGRFSATSFNHTLGILRAILDIGIEAGARSDNPARVKEMKRLTESPKPLRLPEAEHFERFVQEIKNSGSGFSKPCADLVRFLAYGGFRISEAKHITWADCDFRRGKIILRGDPEGGLKGRNVGTTREVPMIPAMRELLQSIRAERSDASPQQTIMRVHECQKAMDRAAEVVGMARMTHHDLRHLFATRCIESGVDIPTVSRWLGHKDGGALAMRVYGHLRDQHSQEMALRVSFHSPEA